MERRTFLALGLVIGAPPGALMSLLPKALRPEDLATELGVFYTVFYLAMAVAQPAASSATSRGIGLALSRGIERQGPL